MKALTFHKYGSHEALNLEEVEKPTPKDNEVLVKVKAASINSWDWELLQGKPFVNRMMFGLLKPKKINILGCDIAGRIEAVGKKVKQFKLGDEVFGDLSAGGWGGYAEYVCSGLLALQGLRKGQLQLNKTNQEQINPAQKVLINGASGGSGTFAVQIAKSFGAEVTGVCSTKKMDFVRSLGADHVIDYAREDFTKNGQQYDLILDAQAYHSIFDYKRALNPKGIYVMHGGGSSQAYQTIFLGPLLSMISSKKMGILMHKPNIDDLDIMNTLFEEDKVIPVIDKHFPLSQGAEAMRYYGEGHAKGKVVITMKQGS
jgi:NADPH:quinone reductase-like Zn-dependent oxidoreductase